MHSDETKKKIGIKSKMYNNKPEVKERARNVAIQFNRTHNIGDLLRQSEKWKNAIKEGRIGGKRDDETKKKISDGLKRYFENNNGSLINKEQHSKIMTKINGKKISQYSKDNKLLNTFDSIVLASKHTGIGRKSIQSNLAERSKSSGGFIWKYSDAELKDACSILE